MSIIHVTGSGGQIAAERTLFVGARIPQQIARMAKPLKTLDKTTVRKLLQAIVTDLEGKEIDGFIFDELKSDQVNEETLAIVYAGLYKLLQSALRIPQSLMKLEVFKEDLLALNIPKDFTEDIASVVFGTRRPVIDNQALESRPRMPKLDSFRWRLDVGISTSALSRVLEPSIMVEMALSDGKLHNFEVPMSKFHELRYSVSSVLREMEDLERRSILKIQSSS